MAVKNLDIKESEVCHLNEGSDPIAITLNEFVDHPSSLKIKDFFRENLLNLIFWK